MLNFFRTKPKLMVGVDISTSVVKVLELGIQASGYSVEHYGIAVLPPEAVVENTIKEVQAVAESVRLASERAKLTVKDAIVAVPDASVIRKIIRMDAALSSQDLEHLIMSEAEKFIPYPLDEVSLDFVIRGPSLGYEGMNDILVVACRSQIVDNRASVVNLAGLNAKVVDVESFAVQRVMRFITDQLPGNPQQQIIAVIDLGSSVTTLTVLKNLEVVFTREEIFGGTQLTRDIQKHYGMGYAEAGLAKKNGELPDDYESEVLAPFRELAVIQIRRALQFYFSLDQNSKIDTIVLVGGTARIPGFAEEIAEQLGIPTLVANPFGNMTVGKRADLDKVSQDASSLVVCCGLTLRGFGL